MFEGVKLFGWSLAPLNLAKLFLALYLLGMFVAGTKTMFWPVINWPMYSARTFSFPAPTTSAIEIVAVTSDGQQIVVPMGRLVTTGREVALIPIFKCAAGVRRADKGWNKAPTSEKECRRYIGQLINRVTPGAVVETIEISEKIWAVEPLAWHPVDAASPLERNILARFDTVVSSSRNAVP